MVDLQPFQKRFIRDALKPGIDTSALSLPRGNGKSTLAGLLVADILDPDNELFRPGTESVLCAASIEQARVVFKVARDILEPRGGYRFLDSHTRIGINHTATKTRLRVIGSNGKTAMGLLNCPWAICDEPGAWEINGGTLLWDALETALGKPGSPMRILVIGTLAPMAQDDSHWWYRLVTRGSRRNVNVMSYMGDAETWADRKTILKANPLARIDAGFRRKLFQERDDALNDSTLRARFVSYRLNVPMGDPQSLLMEASDWERVLQQPVQPREGQPIFGIDLGQNRAWSTVVATWPTGRTEAIAHAPGIPGIEAQEKRDRVGAGVYQQLVEQGRLRVAHGLNVPPIETLVKEATAEWGSPLFVISDRFNEPKLRDAMPGIQLDARVWRYSEGTADIRAFRTWAMDGNLNIEDTSRGLLTASMRAAKVKSDDAGNIRMVKKYADNTGRDDCAAALVLLGGALDRHKPYDAPVTPGYSGMVNP